jgi:hypothetical protein
MCPQNIFPLQSNMPSSTQIEPPEAKVILRLNAPGGDVVHEILDTPPRPCTAREIPTVDLSNLYKGNIKDLENIAREIKSAAETSGVFYIKNHGVSPEIIEEARIKSLEYAITFSAKKSRTHSTATRYDC